MSQQLLTEYFNWTYDPKVIKEQVASGKPVKLSGLLQKADSKNGNGRIYPFGVLKREVDKYQDFVKNRRSAGELDHQDSPIIALERVSHLIVEVSFNDNTGEVNGTIELLNTPMGKIAQELLSGGVNLGISSRGVGSLIREGDYDKVGDDYQLVTWDIVSQGSVDNSWLTVREGKTFQNVCVNYPTTQEINRLLSKEERVRYIVDEILSTGK